MQENQMMGSPCRKHGHSGVRYNISGACVDCQQIKDRNPTPERKMYLSDLNKKFYIENKDEISIKDRIYLSTPKARAAQLWTSAKERAIKKKQNISITKEWIEDKLKIGRCELSGLPFDFVRNEGAGRGSGKKTYAPSLDRIDSTKGYEPSNCRVILWALNTAFSNWGEDVFAVIASQWLKGEQRQEPERMIKHEDV